MQAQEKQNQVNPAIEKAKEAFEAGDLLAAEQSCNLALHKDPFNVAALNILSACSARQGKLQDAIFHLQKACSLDPDSANLRVNLARLYNLAQMRNKAFSELHNAIKLDPENREAKILYSAIIQEQIFQQYSPLAVSAIHTCLKDPKILHQRLMASWYSLLELDPSFLPFWDLYEYKDYESFAKGFDLSTMAPVLNHSFFIDGLKNLIVNNEDYERTLTYIRRYFLEHNDHKDLDRFTSFLAGLAQQCFYNEYIFELSDAETALLDKLSKERFNDLLILGCYRSLFYTDNPKRASEILHGLENGEAHSVAKMQIDEPFAEKELVDTIPSLSPIEDKVSNEVRSQYEEYQYPRWRYTDVPHIEERLKELARGKEVLVAGCGTGLEAISAATHFPYANVTAIDLSKASISYGMRKASEMGVENVEFLHADILELDKLDKQFDLIMSSGVIHHMEDPIAGWKSILGRLKPGGLMRMALYSEIGREDVVRSRNYIAEHGLKDVIEDIKSYRATVFNMDESDPVKRISKHLDFYALSTCRDLVFHCMEHRYTMLQLEEIFDDLALELVSIRTFHPSIKQQYIEMYPDDPMCVNFKNWHEFEEMHPLSFTAMYNFVCGRAGECKPGELPEWLAFLEGFMT
jgi:2-polyprenyl-3-methyl-5-hydroxy-6-metoxy-1,4-benzoquinol methylase